MAPGLGRWLPRSGLLASLVGIAIGFLGMAFLLQIYHQPVVGLTVLALVLITYLARCVCPYPVAWWL